MAQDRSPRREPWEKCGIPKSPGWGDRIPAKQDFLSPLGSDYSVESDARPHPSPLPLGEGEASSAPENAHHSVTFPGAGIASCLGESEKTQSHSIKHKDSVKALRTAGRVVVDRETVGGGNDIAFHRQPV